MKIKTQSLDGVKECEAENKIYSCDGYQFCFCKGFWGVRNLLHYESGTVLVPNITKINDGGLFGFLKLVVGRPDFDERARKAGVLNSLEEIRIGRVKQYRRLNDCKVLYLKGKEG